MSEQHLKPTEWLEREDRTDRSGRRERLEWIAGLMPDAEYLGFPGGLLSKFHFDEMRYCFVYGQFLAVVLLGLAYIERTLAAHFYGGGQDELERASMAKLLQCAMESGWITQDEFQRIDRARELRNALTHFRPPLHEETVEYRAMTQKHFPYAVIEEDARHVIEVVFHVLASNAV